MGKRHTKHEIKMITCRHGAWIKKDDDVIHSSRFVKPLVITLATIHVKKE